MSFQSTSEPAAEEPGESPLSVRSLCPFCGSSQDPNWACCPEWAATTGATLREPAPTGGRERLLAYTTSIGRRLNEASHLLVMLLASSSVALLVSVVMQSRPASDRGIRFDAASLIATRPSGMPISVVPAPKPPEPAIVEAKAVADPAPAPAPRPMAVASLPPPPAVAVEPPPLPEPPTFHTGWSAEDLAKWHRLRRGMSRTAVRMIFGYPQWIDRRSTPRTEYWLYTSERVSDGGWIAFFDAEGPVSSWREP